jgi:hypothetical protein
LNYWLVDTTEVRNDSVDSGYREFLLLIGNFSRGNRWERDLDVGFSEGGGVAVGLRGIYEGVALSKSCCHCVCPDGIVCVARSGDLPSVKGRGTGAVAIRTCTRYVHIWFQSP